MKKLLVIPERDRLSESLRLADEYDLGFEYNDFFAPSVLDDESVLKEIENQYNSNTLPSYCTMHGAFFDVIPFSPDEKIRQISEMRIEQSISAAKRMHCRAVVFHTNYNPFLNSDIYIRSWIEKNIVYWTSVLKEHSDISIYLENMFDTSPEIMRQLAEALSIYENFGICLDFAHASISSTDQRLWAQQLGRYVKHIHLNDNDLKADLHLPWGSGKIDRSKFYECYIDYMSNATVLLETPSVESQRKSIQTLLSDGFIR